MGFPTKIINSILETLTPRGKEVVIGRFGLSAPDAEPLTLAALGSKYGVTRERIRQIEAASLATLKKKVEANKECQAVLAKGKKFLEKLGGVAKEETLLGHIETAAPGLNKNQLALLLETTGSFHFREADQDFHSFYYLDKKSLEASEKFLNQLAKNLKPQKEAVLTGRFGELFAKFAKNEKVTSAQAENYLAISKKVFSNPYGDVGLAEWPEIKPQNIRDRIYLVLKKHGKPLHFTEITTKINETKFDAKVALAPTVHNELIKDNRFVLVGRGIYGLTEHGFKPGTVQEVIRRILKEKGSLNTKEISLAVQKERILKPNTIMVNLQNRKFFKRLDNGNYQIRES